MNRIALVAALSAAALTAAACSDTTDDVVQAPAAGEAPAPVSETRADTATTRTAVAMGMTRQQLEDADILSSTNTKLGEVDTLVLDPAGKATHIVVELEGPGDPKVVVPIDQLRSIARNSGADVDLTTNLTAAQLQALPAWTPNAAR
ncbi:MAG: hypothetical protein EON91_02890 [Brevundimonas sp.]|uniref:PRC-barrel domain-containing protein n=1 Tax=Brevundimonas sp. TaxID=1871086 RepID=UPI0012193F8D|nr:PRC-barrel domain-containing protein [Brevundimonas sp.]RZJ18985.1 MAG: hypothetical protein EON91_02890 [Brevundimonas sp.]